MSAVGAPRITVIVPSYQQGAFIRATLESIQQSSIEPVAVHVLDGGSTDETIEILREWQARPNFRWRSGPDGGPGCAVNEGLAATVTEYAAVQSSDDVYLDGALDRAMDVLDRHPDVGGVYADAETMDADGRVTGRTDVGEYSVDRLLAKQTFVMQSSAVFRTRAAVAVGGYGRFAFDAEMWLRMALVTRLLRVDDLWSRYRYHDGQRDRMGSRIVRDRWDLIRALRPELGVRHRRLARVGGYLTEHRYGDRFGWRRATSLWHALALHPQLIAWDRFPRRDLSLPLRWVAGRAKQCARKACARRPDTLRDPSSHVV